MAQPAFNDPIDRSFEVASRLAEDARRAEQQRKRLSGVESIVDRQFRDQERLVAEYERQAADTLAAARQCEHQWSGNFDRAYSAASKMFEDQRWATERIAESASMAASTRIAEVGSAVLKGFEDQRWATERIAESASMAASTRIAEVGSAVLKGFEDQRWATERIAESASMAASTRIAEVGSAVLKGFEDQRWATERLAELPRVADLLGGVGNAVALDQAALAESLSAAGQLVTSLEPFRTLIDRPQRAPDWTRTHDETDLAQPPAEDIEVDAATEPALDLALFAALVLIVALAAVLYMIGVLSADALQAWDDAVLIVHLIDAWEPDPAISGYVKLCGYISALALQFLVLRYIRRGTR